MTSKTELLKLPPPNGTGPSRPEVPRSDPAGAYVAYHVSCHTQICTNCSSYHSYNHVSVSTVGARQRIFSTVRRFEYNLPVFVHHNEPEKVPACRHCAATLRLTHLVPPPKHVASSPGVRAAWRKGDAETKRTPQSIMSSNDLEW